MTVAGTYLSITTASREPIGSGHSSSVYTDRCMNPHSPHRAPDRTTLEMTQASRGITARPARAPCGPLPLLGGAGTASPRVEPWIQKHPFHRNPQRSSCYSDNRKGGTPQERRPAALSFVLLGPWACGSATGERESQTRLSPLLNALSISTAVRESPPQMGRFRIRDDSPLFRGNVEISRWAVKQTGKVVPGTSGSPGETLLEPEVNWWGLRRCNDS